MPIDVLVVGSGAREYALGKACAQSPRCRKVYMAPGNGGTGKFGENVPLKATDIEGIVAFAKRRGVGLIIVGPDDPLALGLVDLAQREGIRAFGPTKAAARFEWSKAYAKRIMRKRRIPTAPFEIFYEHECALEHVYEQGAPLVVKADGLALGKAAYVCHTLAAIEEALDRIMVKRVHGDAGKVVVIEKLLTGEELSVTALCDGKTARLLLPTQDHKAAFDGDVGPNTGGMGAWGPVSWVHPETMADIDRRIIQPAMDACAEAGSPFVGWMYPGLMMQGQRPYVLEYNVRAGDPEWPILEKKLKTDILEVIEACLDGRLADINLEWHPGFAVGVVLASEGYPGTPKTGVPIYGIEEAEKIPGVTVFHAGTKLVDGQLVTSGGRVALVVGEGDTLLKAQAVAAQGRRTAKFEGMHARSDIGDKGLLPHQRVRL